MKVIQAVGKRKSAVARATITNVPGVRVNSFMLETIQPEMYRQKMNEPIQIAGEIAAKIGLKVTVNGGGKNSQADAVRTAIANALAQHDKRLHKIFLDYDRTLLVSDVRRKETHKPNRHGKARAKTQKSYR